MDQKLSLDIMSEIYKLRLNEALDKDEKGQLTFEEFAQIASDSVVIHHEHYKDLANTCKQFGDTIIRMRKEISRERRILDLFLKNHGLDWEYHNFESRILERIFAAK